MVIAWVTGPSSDAGDAGDAGPKTFALRTDATRRELRAALDAVPGVHNVQANVEGSSIVAVVNVSPPADQAAINVILGRYAIQSRLEVMP